jgi:hypothetical protein
MLTSSGQLFHFGAGHKAAGGIIWIAQENALCILQGRIGDFQHPKKA